MKKIILFIPFLFAFVFIHGQQTMTPDIQKLIQERLKKSQDKKIIKLNPLLKNNQTNSLAQLNSFLRRADKPIIALTDATPQAKFLQTLADGSKVYALPQDNMPCIVPDMSKYKDMSDLSPNVHPLFFEYLNQNRAGQIPNAVKPQKIIPDNSNK